MRRVREVVLVYVGGRAVFLSPGDEVPDGVTVDVESALTPEDASGDPESPVTPTSDTGGGGSDGDATPTPDAPTAPPTAGPGSSVDRWRHYAAELEVHVDRHASRADIIAAIAEAGFPTE